VKHLLAAKGIATQDEIDARVRVTDAGSPAQGARMVARAWIDPAYRTRLLADGALAAEEAGIPMRGLPPLGVLENQPGLHHLVVCTLCSCYPRAVLGYPPFWFKSQAYRAIRPACWRNGARCCLPAPNYVWWTAPPTTAGWCCRCGRQAPKAGTPTGWQPWCATPT
jgi:hypothetical protein